MLDIATEISTWISAGYNGALLLAGVLFEKMRTMVENLVTSVEKKALTF